MRLKKDLVARMRFKRYMDFCLQGLRLGFGFDTVWTGECGVGIYIPPLFSPSSSLLFLNQLQSQAPPRGERGSNHV